MTGLMPSGRFHFGHKMVADQIIWYQKMGADTFICAADLEATVVRDIALEDARRIAIEEYITNYIALGLSEKHLVLSSDRLHSAILQAPRPTIQEGYFKRIKAIYGDDLTTGKLFSAITQAADILHPQLKEYGGPRPTIVPVGADQDPHLRLTRDLAGRFQTEYRFIPPSSTYHKFMSGLSGGKMSSSDPASHIALSEEPEAARRKIMNAKTGGRATIAEQKKLGGVPEDCMVYEMFVYHLIEDDGKLSDIYTECRSGDRICGDCKKNAQKNLSPS